jgi:hypothetical protein
LYQSRDQIEDRMALILRDIAECNREIRAIFAAVKKRAELRREYQKLCKEYLQFPGPAEDEEAEHVLCVARS